MPLLTLTKIIRTIISEGNMPLEKILELGRFNGVECELAGCTLKSETCEEVTGEERNVCRRHAQTVQILSRNTEARTAKDTVNEKGEKTIEERPDGAWLIQWDDETATIFEEVGTN